MLIAALVIDAKKTPDWSAARAAVEAMTQDELESIYIAIGDDVGDDVDLRGELLSAVTYCANAIESSSLCAHIQIRGANVYIIGAPSWGDAPEGTKEFILFNGSPAYEAAGFEHQIFVTVNAEEQRNG